MIKSLSERDHWGIEAPQTKTHNIHESLSHQQSYASPTKHLMQKEIDFQHKIQPTKPTKIFF